MKKLFILCLILLAPGVAAAQATYLDPLVVRINDMPFATVEPGAPIVLSVSGTIASTTQGNDFESISWRIGTGLFACIDVRDLKAGSAKVFTHDIDTAAPFESGVYDVTVRIHGLPSARKVTPHTIQRLPDAVDDNCQSDPWMEEVLSDSLGVSIPGAAATDADPVPVVIPPTREEVQQIIEQVVDTVVSSSPVPATEPAAATAEGEVVVAEPEPAAPATPPAAQVRTFVQQIIEAIFSFFGWWK